MVCQGVSQKEEKKKGVGEHGGGAEGRLFWGAKKGQTEEAGKECVCKYQPDASLPPSVRPSVGVVLPAHFSPFTSGQTAKRGGKDVKGKSGVFLTRLPILFLCNGLHYASLYLRIHRQRLTLRPTVAFLVR